MNTTCSEKRTVFLELRSRKTVSFEEPDNIQGQIYEHVFAPNGGYCVYYPLTRVVLKIGEYIYLINQARGPYWENIGPRS